MKKVIVFLTVFALTGLNGCNFKFPITAKSTIPIDQNILGVWHLKSDPESGFEIEEINVTILPKNKTEYLINYPLDEDGELFYVKAYHVQIAGISAVQLELMGTSEGFLGGIEPYTLVKIFIENETMVIKFLNPEVIDTDVSSKEEFRKMIVENQDNEELFFFPIKLVKLTDIIN